MIAKNNLILVLSVAVLSLSTCKCSTPNIILILTDDQDLLLNSLEYLTKIDKLLTSKGAIFANAVSNSW